jgi:hypothetical protein
VVIHIDYIIHAVHLMPIMRTAHFVDHSVTIHTSLNDFKLFYLNSVKALRLNVATCTS